MRTIEEMIIEYVESGMTNNQAESNVCQQIIINKISKSPLADNVLIKGGVVMFHLTKNIRRATIDLDFDFIRHDISVPSIKAFINLLNEQDKNYKIKALEITELRQDDYHGKRVVVEIKDKSTAVKFKLDIGVHTLLAIEQPTMCFSFSKGETFLKANPPEQIFAEKLYSLARHGALSGRRKDIYDMYYLIKHEKLDRKVVKKCLEMITLNGLHGIRSIEEISERVNDALGDKEFLKQLNKSKDKWLDEDDDKIVKEILDFVYSL